MAAQIEALVLDPAHPLIICDCDEVILQFIAGLERFLETRGCRLQLDSFRLHGNIKHADTGETVADDAVTGLLQDFYARTDHALDVVPGAREALAGLEPHAQIVLLTNVSEEAKIRRQDNLAAGGIAYPVIANHGLKGPAVAALAARSGRPVFFLDDIPHNIHSARTFLPEVFCVHYVADPRLDRLLETAPESDHRARDWAEIARVIRARLDDART